MNGINEFGVNEFLSRRLNINDSPGPAGTLAPEVMPVLQVMPPSTEDDFLRGVRRCAAGDNISGVALEYGTAVLENPAGSDTLIMLDQVIISRMENGLTTLHFVESTAFMPGVGARGTAIRDSRWNGTASSRSTAVFRMGTTATAPHISWTYALTPDWYAAASPQYFDMGVVLKPSTCYIIYTAAVANALGVQFLWRERPAQPSELG